MAVNNTMDDEQPHTLLNDNYYIGLDEAGLGCLFGRAYMSAVLWSPSLSIPDGLRDSKKISEKKRSQLFNKIKQINNDYVISYVTNKEIDDTNVYRGKIKGMIYCLTQLWNQIGDKRTQVKVILIDGNSFSLLESEKTFLESIQPPLPPIKCIVKGDDKYVCISAASILAKVSRDTWINELCESHPIYKNFSIHTHKGYGTAKHWQLIQQYGVTSLHRLSYTFQGVLLSTLNNCYGFNDIPMNVQPMGINIPTTTTQMSNTTP